jgi:hypothetical protein
MFVYLFVFDRHTGLLKKHLLGSHPSKHVLHNASFQSKKNKDFFRKKEDKVCAVADLLCPALKQYD